MGYTTNFTGAISLSRKLTLKEAKELLDIQDCDDADKVKEITGTRSYLQWVPAKTLEHIVWDGGEKFYDYVPLLKWVCQWLKDKGIGANGILFWSGESANDVGRLIVADNQVTVDADDRPTDLIKPMTLRDLQKMALDQITQEEDAEILEDGK